MPDYGGLPEPDTESTGQRLECDIVMAGGITSGIIYPGAVAMIARRFSFRSIGGTSVGAIAAAVTAAAEYGRRTGSNAGAFDGIAKIPTSLGEQAADQHSRLFHLFTPEPATKPLFTLVMPLFKGGSTFKKIFGVLTAALFTPWVAIPVAVATILGLVLFFALIVADQWVLAIFALLAAVALVLAVWLAALYLRLRYSWLPAFRENGFGICTGKMPDSIATDTTEPIFEGLTAWIHRVVQTAAGRAFKDEPLTFGDLWNCAPAAAQPAPEADAPQRQAPPRAIDLAMIASDISRQRTVQLPFIEFPTPVYVRISELERYFPPSIVEWMTKHPGDALEQVQAEPGVIRIPSPENIPVVFGARLSLSFPILLTAVEMLTPDFAKAKGKDKEPAQLRPLWYSDGGLTSNFPIHFFDSPIPSRPTFCLNLVDFGTELPEDDGSASQPGTVQSLDQARLAENRKKPASDKDPGPGDDVWQFVTMITGNQFVPPPFTDFDKPPSAAIGGFLGTLVNTARAWSDNQLLIAPGVRDRVVNIALKSDEGGLNLDMKPEVILDLDYRGRAAGLLISSRFDPDAQLDPSTGRASKKAFANHRWVRYRNFMGAFEDLSRRYALSLKRSDEAARKRGELLLGDMIDDKPPHDYGYRIPKEAQGFYHDYTEELDRLARTMAEVTRKAPIKTFDLPSDYKPGEQESKRGPAPRPKMRVQLRPLTGNDQAAERADLPAPPDPISPPQTP